MSVDQPMAIVTPTPSDPDGASLDSALWRVWLALGLFLAAFGLGVRWDRDWHAIHPFEGFWSPPHLFIYGAFILLAFTVAHTAASPTLRPWFGAGFQVPGLAYALPGCLALALGGIATVSTAGALDSIWHTAFGLDETGWSLPHAMLGWGTMLTYLSLLACRLALEPHRPIAWYTRATLGALALMIILQVVIGLDNNLTPDRVRAVAAFPGLAADPAAQHAIRIYLSWNLTRTNPLFVPLSALAAGVGLAVVQGWTGRRSLFLLGVAIATLLRWYSEGSSAATLGLGHDPRNWLPLPLLPAVLMVVLLQLARLPERWAWGGAGLVFGILVAQAWSAQSGVVFLAGPAMIAGAMIGQGMFRAVSQPTPSRVGRFLAASVGVPMFLGVLDLYLRIHTP